MGNILLKLINFNKLQSYRKLDLISYDHIETSQCCIQMHFGTVWTVCARKKSAQKVIVTFFLNIFHVKTKWNIVYKYLKLPSPNALNINIFGHSATFGVFELSLNYPILNFKKRYAQKTSGCGTASQMIGFYLMATLVFNELIHFCWERGGVEKKDWLSIKLYNNSNLLNPFLVNVSILYPLKIPENQRFSVVSRGYKMSTLAINRLTYNELIIYVPFKANARFTDQID